jgi:hypothetical protein
MSNLTDFFPAAAGGGGFTKSLKYSTARAINGDFINAASYTVNPANDLGLADGASVGYFLVAGGGSGSNQTGTSGNSGKGGKIIYGIATIVNASVDLVLTIGVGATTADGTGSDSTITGGLTISTSNGGQFGGSGYYEGSGGLAFGAPGINGYGASGGPKRAIGGWPSGASMHGYGTASMPYNSNVGGEVPNVGGDGAIILNF